MPRSRRPPCCSTGVCPASGVRLQLLDLQPSVRSTLAAHLRSLASFNDRARADFTAFADWLSACEEKPDVVVDGANVAFFQQNKAGGFSYEQVDKVCTAARGGGGHTSRAHALFVQVVRELQGQGRRVLLVLHSKYFSPYKDWTSVKPMRKTERMALVRRFKERETKALARAGAAGEGGGGGSGGGGGGGSGGGAKGDKAEEEGEVVMKGWVKEVVERWEADGKLLYKVGWAPGSRAQALTAPSLACARSRWRAGAARQQRRLVLDVRVHAVRRASGDERRAEGPPLPAGARAQLPALEAPHARLVRLWRGRRQRRCAGRARRPARAAAAPAAQVYGARAEHEGGGGGGGG